MFKDKASAQYFGKILSEKGIKNMSAQENSSSSDAETTEFIISPNGYNVLMGNENAYEDFVRSNSKQFEY